MSNIITGMFGSKKPSGAERDVAELVSGCRQRAIHVVKATAPSRSYLGGDPQLPNGTAWPCRNQRPLEFLARVSLAEIQIVAPIEWLPLSGALLFFYDAEEQPWGFDSKDRGGWAVLAVPDLERPVNPPAVSGEASGQQRAVTLKAISVLPSGESQSVSELALSEAEFDRYFELREVPFERQPKHQVGGCPAPVQGDYMALECHLASHGINCGTPEGYASPGAKAIESGAENWRLLFQMDSDDELGLMWGDTGMLYFWVEEAAARRADFSNAWLVLQCC